MSLMAPGWIQAYTFSHFKSLGLNSVPYMLPRVLTGMRVLWGWWGAEPWRCLLRGTWDPWGPRHSSCPHRGQPHFGEVGRQ